MKFYCEDREAVLGEVQSTSEGLSSSEAARRLEANGKNKLAAAKGKSIIRRFLEQLADPMIIILLVAAAISGVLAVVEGESFADVIIILAVVVVNAVLGVYQALTSLCFILSNTIGIQLKAPHIPAIPVIILNQSIFVIIYTSRVCFCFLFTTARKNSASVDAEFNINLA